MAIRVRCSHCSHVFRVPDKYGGRQGKCPGCGDVTRLLDADRMPPIGPTAAGGNASNVISEQRTIVDRSDATERRRNGRLRTATPLDEGEQHAENAMAPLFDRSSAGAASSGAASSDATAGVSPGATPVIGAESPFPNIAVEGANTGTRRTTSRQATTGATKSSPVLLFAALGGVVLLLLLGVGAFGLYAIFSGGDETDNAVAPSATDGAPAPPVEPRRGTDAGTPPPTNPMDGGAADPSAELLAQARTFTVRLRVSRPQGDTTATGFYIDDKGWIATSWERVHGATSVHVQFDGSSSSVAASGIVAEDRRSGLILIAAHPSRPFGVARLAGVGENIDELPPRTPLASCAMPAWGDKWLSSCTVIQLRATGGLPPAVLEQARRTVGDGAGLTWIETQGPFAADAAGGPLLDDAGKVVGVCLFADPSRQRTYAIHVRSLRDLLDSVQGPAGSLQPFAEENYPPIAVAPPSTAGTPPDPAPPISPTTPTTPPSANRASALAEHLASLHRQCESQEWLPRTAEQYAVSQQFALAALAASDFADDDAVPRDQRDAVRQSLTEALHAEFVWSDADRRQQANRSAAQALDADQAQGVYAFGEVTYPPGRITIDGRPTIGVQLDGTRDMLFFTVHDGIEELRGGTRWLILGEYLGRIPDLSGDPTAPDSRRASLIRVKHLIGEPAGASDPDPLPPLK